MAGLRRDMQDVELVDAALAHDPVAESPCGLHAAGSPLGDDVPSAGRPATPVERARGRRRRAAVLAVVAVLALTGGVVADRRDARRVAALAAVPGVVQSLERPVVELWGTSDRPVGDLHLLGDRLVGPVARDGGGVDVVALQPATGEHLWRTTVGAGGADPRWTSCVVPGRHGPDVAGAAAAAPVVVCVVVDETTTTEASALGTRTYPTSARLVVVDVATGDVLRDQPTVPTGVLATLDDDVVLAEVGPQGRARVVRLDPRSGRERWSATGPDLLPADQFRQRTVRVQAAGDLVAVDGGSVQVLSARDGSVVDGWSPDPSLGTDGQVQVLGGGTLLARPAVADGGWGTEVVDRASGRRSTAAGYPVPVQPDDGSLAGSVLMLSVAGLDLLDLDVGTGHVRWTVPTESGGWPVVMEGRVVRAEGRSLQARDGRTGQVLWSAALPASTGSPVMTDGRVGVVSVPDGRGGGELLAFALSDGRPQWSVDLPEEVLLSSADGLMLGWSGSRLVALGAPGGRG